MGDARVAAYGAGTVVKHHEIRRGARSEVMFAEVHAHERSMNTDVEKKAEVVVT